MRFSSDLIQILKFYRFIDDKEADPFHRYIDNSKEEIDMAKDLMPTTIEGIRLEKTIVSRLNSLQIFLDIMSDVEKLLRKKLTPKVFKSAVTNCDKTIAYIACALPEDPIQKEATKQYFRSVLPGEILERTILCKANIDEEKESILIPVDAFISVPSRTDNTTAAGVSLFGTPTEIHLRREGILIGKPTTPEYHHRFWQEIFLKIAPASDEGFKNGALKQSEFDYLKKFIYKIQYLMVLYEGIKKGETHMESDQPLLPSKTYIASNKLIESSVKRLIKRGLDPINANLIKSASFKNKVKVKCILPKCNNTFIPINKNHKRCGNCSKPGVYLKEWRASRADHRSDDSNKD